MNCHMSHLETLNVCRVLCRIEDIAISNPSNEEAVVHCAEQERRVSREHSCQSRVDCRDSPVKVFKGRQPQADHQGDHDAQSACH